MTDRTDFETMLERRMRAYAATAARPVRRDEIARSTMWAAATPVASVVDLRRPAAPGAPDRSGGASCCSPRSPGRRSSVERRRDPWHLRRRARASPSGQIRQRRRPPRRARARRGRPGGGDVPGTTTLRCTRALPAAPGAPRSADRRLHPDARPAVVVGRRVDGAPATTAACCSSAVERDGLGARQRRSTTRSPTDSRRSAPRSERRTLAVPRHAGRRPRPRRWRARRTALDHGRAVRSGDRDLLAGRRDGPATRRRRERDPLPDGRVLVVGGGAEVGDVGRALRPGDRDVLADRRDDGGPRRVLLGDAPARRARPARGRLVPDQPRIRRRSPDPTATAEIYDPATGTFSAVGPMAAPRSCTPPSILADGTVLVVGGAHDVRQAHARSRRRRRDLRPGDGSLPAHRQPRCGPGSCRPPCRSTIGCSCSATWT